MSIEWQEHIAARAGHFQSLPIEGGFLQSLRPLCLILLLGSFSLILCVTGYAQKVDSLPDAPQPAPADPRDNAFGSGQNQSLPAHASRRAASPIEHASRQKRKWAQSIDPGERIVPLYPRDKWKFWLTQEFAWYSPVPEFISAGYGQLADTPDYGSDAGAFGEKLGAAFIRDATMRFMCGSLFPVMTHEDPRYYRKASGGYWSRAGWAAERAFVTQNDNGSRSFNYSNIVGHLAASALTPLYYPPKSATPGMVLQTWSTSIAGDAGNNLLLEFVPDAMNVWRRHRARRHSSRMNDNSSN